MDDALRNRIRERLGHLQSENGEALFEKVCAELARKRIHANIRMNAFVAGHGDRGRDFENIPGQALDLVMSLGREHGVSPSTQIVFACTLGRTRLSNKIKKDIDVIHAEGPKPDYIYHFCETDFPTAEQTALRLWCEREYDTRLEILTGNTIADVLAEVDLLSIARDQLRIHIEPSAPFVLSPVDTEEFVGRQEEINRLSDLLINGEQATGGRIARFLARLRSAINPLDELIVQGEADMDLIRLFALSLEFLTTSEQRAFACLSACATQDFGVKAVSAAMDNPDSSPLRARLVRLSLIEVKQETARYRFHALVDDYAHRLADRWALTHNARRRHAQAMAALLRSSADAQGAALLQLLEDQADIRQAAEYLVDYTNIDLPILQGVNRLVEQTALGTWHQGLLKRAQKRLSSDDQQWFSGVLLLQQGKRAQALGNLAHARDAFERSLQIGRSQPL